ncbi:MAG: methionyl-tRNA formyltransferase [Acidobacteriota bacterium]
MVLNVVFLGTSQFAVPSLQALLNSGDFSVTGVFTQPDRRAGRGKKICCPPVKVLASEYGVEVYQPERIRSNENALETMKRLNPDIAVVVAFGQILPEEFYTVPRLGTVNVHSSLLPAYRGASPVVRAILNGDKVTGVSIMKIDKGMDNGDVLAMKEVPVPPTATAGYMEKVLASEGAGLLVNTVIEYSMGRIKPVKQDHEKATYAPKLSKKDGIINWDRPSSEIHNQIRAMNPWPGSVTSFRGGRLEVKIWKSEVSDRKTDYGTSPGTICSLDHEGVEVACGSETSLKVREVQLCGRSRISAYDFVNGCRVIAGEVLGE